MVFTSSMTEPAGGSLPPSVARVLSRFRALGREEKMQALLHYAKQLEPVPDRLAALDRAAFNVPECQTRVDLFPEVRDGKLYFYADLNSRQSPTIAAFLPILFSPVNGQPPETRLAIPSAFVRQRMEGSRLPGSAAAVNALISRVNRPARNAITA